ncbi:hypothetical protein APHAL10511_001346 [Amanita phalloides]|nr:hypothetical protein APHAL10511_001346 [Amanita phalloides]
MRVSRPDFAVSWQPFYSSSPSFSAHSSASIISLQGTVPLTGHPKTLRDFTHVSELLALPSAFGSIQLGETFSSCLCVNNETSAEVADVGLKVEIQTASSKTLLAEFGGPNHRLAAASSVETVVNHEIKELGQHVLACSVTYRLPLGARGVPGAAEEPSDPSLQTFRKFYKFVVTNTLSVKTKVHTARSPSALTTSSEKDKVFIEVHIQNLSQQPLYFDQMHFECVEDWQAEDANVLALNDGEGQEKSIYSNTMALIQPQDTRQYVYILYPKVTMLTPVAYAPGTVVPLGRLNISWRSSFGEPGRLLTSMLSRRIPLTVIAPQQQGSALPAYLKRTIAGNVPSRPQSPQSIRSRPSTPPGQRVGSPPPAARARPMSSTLTQPSIVTPSNTELEASLIVLHVPRNSIVAEKPFTLKLALVLSHTGKVQGRRVVKIAIQHLQSPRVTRTVTATTETVSSRLPSSGTTTPMSMAGVISVMNMHQTLGSTSRTSLADESAATVKSSQQLDLRQEETNLPSPTFDGVDELASMSAQPSVVYVGPSTIFLPPVTLDMEVQADKSPASKPYVVQEFEVTYVPLRCGFTSFGGLRALLVEDGVVDVGGEGSMASGGKISTLKEWDTVGEIWVASCKGDE